MSSDGSVEPKAESQSEQAWQASKQPTRAQKMGPDQLDQAVTSWWLAVFRFPFTQPPGFKLASYVNFEASGAPNTASFTSQVASFLAANAASNDSTVLSWCTGAFPKTSFNNGATQSWSWAYSTVSNAAEGGKGEDENVVTNAVLGYLDSTAASDQDLPTRFFELIYTQSTVSPSA